MSTPEDHITPEGAGAEPAPVPPAEPEVVEATTVEEPEPAAEPEPEPEPDYKDLYVRAAAETDNVRKRARRDVEVAHGRGMAKLAKELLPALDNLERALAATEAQDTDPDHELTKGIRLVQQELVGALARVGIVQDAPKGDVFDPHRHEAIAQMPVEGVAAGTITEVYSAGYLLGEDVLRAAKVVVAQ